MPADHPSATTNPDGSPRTAPPRGADPKTPPPAQPADWGVPETEVVSRTRVACDGGEGALGHPRVWLQIDDAVGWVECGYCDKRYILGGRDTAPGSNVSVGEETAGDRTDGDGLDARG